MSSSDSCGVAGILVQQGLVKVFLQDGFILLPWAQDRREAAKSRRARSWWRGREEKELREGEDENDVRHSRSCATGTGGRGVRT